MSTEPIKACGTCKYQLFTEWDEPCASCTTPELDAPPTHWVESGIDADEEVSLKPEDVEEYDNVNHPKHYCREGAMECIDEMVLAFGIEAVKSFCLCNVWKYRYRSSEKNGEEDIAKSNWYMNKYKELCGR